MTLREAGHLVLLLGANREGRVDEEVAGDLKLFRVSVASGLPRGIWSAACSRVSLINLLWRKAAQERYNWDIEGRRLVSLYRALCD